MPPDAVGDLHTALILSQLDVVVSLQIHPELGCGSKISCQPKSRVRADRPLATSDVIDASHRHLQLDREAVDCQPKRFQKILPQRFAGMDRRHGLGFFCHIEAR